MKKFYKLTLTTQGPSYPPSEVGNNDGDFVVLGLLNEVNNTNTLEKNWGMALVSKDSPTPTFGEELPYDIKRMLSIENDGEMILYTLASPLPCNNYPHVASPFYKKNLCDLTRDSYPLHLAPISDETPWNTRQLKKAITLKQWCKASGCLTVNHDKKNDTASFNIECNGLIPNSLYSVIGLRRNNLAPKNTTRPEPLGIPNVFTSNDIGQGHFSTKIESPFQRHNPIISIAILFMSSQMSYGGAISGYGLGIDIHVQLKLLPPGLSEFIAS
ncbi:MAG: hypothetical protein COV52_05150 [Gammaproteobacteria bacterium CG11_big_fil_rev_8_21_14_0_20_46_22]|nr:MAG: hypothetical protein COW05_10105 [Gammaproteobacteria bacterium CG12_big_fil_rev_8_21_14_0_65_46_12]PIR11183.1 MAG: hypothetical protein COV52_05150 [Gammaproteobacteria bacterium CG11_big_fil_rev_8_21_14_0_20_46_22]